MKFLLLVFILLGSLRALAGAFPAPGYNDRTAAVMKDMESKGLELIQERPIEGIQVKLYLASTAKAAIAKGAFLIPDPNFDQEKLNNFILESFETSLAYIRQINPNQEIKSLNLVLVDRGGDVGTISEVPFHSRIIELHLVRWHKYYLRNTRSFVHVSGIHEFAHIINYMYSPKETKLHREMTGVLVECANLIQLSGIDSFIVTYRKNFTSKITDLSVFNTDNYTNMNVIRNMAFTLYKNLYTGIYKAPTDSRKATEQFVMSYLTNPLDDQAGFNDSLLRSKIMDADGKPLDFTRLKADTLKELSPSNN